MYDIRILRKYLPINELFDQSIRISYIPVSLHYFHIFWIAWNALPDGECYLFRLPFATYDFLMFKIKWNIFFQTKRNHNWVGYKKKKKKITTKNTNFKIKTDPIRQSFSLIQIIGIHVILIFE